MTTRTHNRITIIMVILALIGAWFIGYLTGYIKADDEARQKASFVNEALPTPRVHTK